MTQVEARVHRVGVAAALTAARDHPRPLQVPHDPLHRPLGEADQIGHLQTADLAALSVGAVRALDSADLAALGTGQIVALTTAQVASLTSAQLAGLTSDQIGAIETADLVLMRADPLDVPIALAIGRGTLRKMRQNLSWAVGYNAIALPIAAGVFASWGLVLRPEMAALSMSGSSVIVAVNALMLKRLRLPRAHAEGPPAEAPSSNFHRTTV